MTQEQTQTTAPETDTLEDGSLDAAAQAFETRDNAPPVEGADAEEQEADTESGPESEAEEAETEQDDSAEFVELDYEGVKIRVEADKAEEAKKALLRQSDYSRKMNELSAREKQVTATIEQAELVRKGAEKFAESLATVRMMDTQIKQYESLDWQKLRAEDPAQYAAYAADFQSLRMNKAQAEMQARSVASEVEEARSQAVEAQRAEMFEAVRKAIPSWSNELGQQLTDFALSKGVKYETLATTTDPGVILALHDAMKYAALQKQKVDISAKAKAAPPVLKPGAPKAKPTQAADAMARLKRSNSVDDAAAAFLSRMK
jgi:hypothetical protein